jgi:protein SCO1/2
MRGRISLFAALFLLAGCGAEKPWHATKVSALPDLSLHMQRASDRASVSESDYRGKIVALYFGYTHCPDVCPTTLANMSDVLTKLGKDADKVRVLFVSVDPNRDTLDILGPYARSFGPQVEGLRPTEIELAETTRRYRIGYSVKTKPTYVVMHMSAVTIFDGNGKARLVASDTQDTTGLADDIRRLLGDKN